MLSTPNGKSIFLFTLEFVGRSVSGGEWNVVDHFHCPASHGQGNEIENLGNASLGGNLIACLGKPHGRP